MSMLVKVVSVVTYTPAFLAPALTIALIGGWLGNMYIKAQLSVKREMSNAKSPVLAILGGAIAGLRESMRYEQLGALLTTAITHSQHLSGPIVHRIRSKAKCCTAWIAMSAQRGRSII